jgi:hypothetical protein
VSGAVTLDVRHNFAAVAQWLERSVQPQVPFATAKALTDTAREAAKAVTDQLPTVFDRPVPFTLRAIGWERATKASLTARVFIRPTQLKYLALEVTGGTRTPPKRALLMPVDIGLNQYGNIPRGKVAALFAKGQGGAASVFSGVHHGVPGLWQRTRKGLRLLVTYKSKAQYKPRLAFGRIVQATVTARLLPNFRAALKQALATAR